MRLTLQTSSRKKLYDKNSPIGIKDDLEHLVNIPANFTPQNKLLLYFCHTML